MKKLWNKGFSFMKLPVDADLAAANEQKDQYRHVRIPHDFLIYDSENLYEDATGWYRKQFEWRPEDGSMLLTFEGIYMDSTIYVNQKEAGEWKYGYSTFTLDITSYLQSGENELIVRVCHKNPNSRWYSGAGIYRDVWMRLVKDAYIEENGIYVHTDCCGDDGKNCDTTYSVKINGSAGEDSVTGADSNGQKQQSALSVSSENVDTIEKIGGSKKVDILENVGASENASVHDWKLTVCTNVIGSGKVAHKLVSKEDGSELSMTLIEQTMQKAEPGHIGGCSATGAVADNAMTDRQVFTVTEPKIWDVEHPDLYELVTTLTGESGEVKDRCETVIGFRSIQIDPDRGFWLNGRQLKLNGVCEHHDLGALGAAFNRTAQRRKYKLLLDMGVNAIRFSHNMPAPGCLELCDELGLLVMDEAFDMWERPKTQYDYGRFFNDWCERDMESFVKRDRNHPCVVLWSVGNEIYDTHADAARGKEITSLLKGVVNRFDPFGNAPVTFASNYLAWENTQHSADVLDAVGYNYTERYYEEHHEKYPGRVIFGSETASIVYSRGIYHFPLAANILADDDEQCSALGNSTTSWGAKSLEACICEDRDMEFSLGQFLWTGTDYIGEPTPYHTKNSYFGQIDTAGFPKDSYYVFQSCWTDHKKKPMIHVFPYWDFNEGQRIDVRVCSNAPEVELFLNGESMGRQQLSHEPGSGDHILADYSITYENGVLEAVGYDESGAVICREEKHSFSDAVKLMLQADKTVLSEEEDMVFITIYAVDSEGHSVENATNRVFVDVKGSGHLVGLDNGDSTDFDSYKGVSRCLFGGKLLAMVMPEGNQGEVEITVQSEGLESATLKLTSEVACRESLHNFANCERKIWLGSKDNIPVRKLAISCQAQNDPDGIFGRTRIITPESGEVSLSVKILPENASDRQVIWQAVNDFGVLTNLVKLVPAGGAGSADGTVTGASSAGNAEAGKSEGASSAGNTEAGASEIVCGIDCGIKIHPLGDGAFRVRCVSKSGTDSTRIISELEFEVQGFGAAFMDPYSFVSGSLYTRSNGNEGAGNEKGVATGFYGETVLTYDHLDFGDTYADEITMPIFALNGEAYNIEIYEGTPEDGSLIGQVVYQKPSIWNVYQEDTWKLDKRLHGVTSISLVAHEKIHIKGFSFKKEQKAYLELSALEADEIYGDSFQKTEDAVEQIGNNVSLVYKNMDFGETGLSAVKICGRAHGGTNTIHVRFSDGENEVKQIVEFPADGSGTGEADVAFGELEFPLTAVYGMQEVSFVFLPGSCFDFMSFEFLP